MAYRITTLERAFELARSGNYPSIAEIRKQLHAEGFSVAQVTGGVLARQLRELIQQAQKPLGR
jgi:hypothetical protein